MKYTDIIWDFNGTIIDDVEAGILSVNKMLSDRGLPTIADSDEYRSVFRFPIIEYYRALGFDFEKESYEELAPIWVAEYLKNCVSSPLRKGIPEAIELFRSMGIRQHILSATQKDMLLGQLEQYGIVEKFDTINGLDNIHAHSKTALAAGWREQFPSATVLFIGDTEHDYKSAKEIGADCALVCGGHQPKSTLLACRGASVYSSIEELCAQFRS